ncbi:MAG: hypothetical protein NT120_02330 [Candidatus Aenigmarchaeota archaeon]|nr:hypothetical protein [Candidatus Aenigmarchaeota archaeon]
MLFGNKKPKELPLEDVRKMAAKGMPDRDIIKDLKHKGYSYSEIEKAMLQAVKEGVDEQPMQSMQPMQEFTMPVATPPVQNQPTQPEFELPTFQEDNQEIDPDQANAILEELVEGVIDEKWQKFETRISKVDETFDKIRAEIRQFEERVSQDRKQSPTRDLEIKISDIGEQIDDLDARVGGLEKAFKQFLPSLTRNIEALSNMIHEIKEKTQLTEEI